MFVSQPVMALLGFLPCSLALVSSRYPSTGSAGRSICTPELSGINGPDLVPQDGLLHLGGCELWSTTNVALSLLVNSPQLIPSEAKTGNDV